MPLLEVVQTRQISASIRLTDTTATQVDQYAAFISGLRRRCRRASSCLRLQQRPRLPGLPEDPGSPEGRLDVADSEGSGC